MPKALDQEHKSALSMSARPVSFATLKTYTTRRDTTKEKFTMVRNVAFRSWP